MSSRFREAVAAVALNLLVSSKGPIPLLNLELKPTEQR